MSFSAGAGRAGGRAPVAGRELDERGHKNYNLLRKIFYNDIWYLSYRDSLRSERAELLYGFVVRRYRISFT